MLSIVSTSFLALCRQKCGSIFTNSSLLGFSSVRGNVIDRRSYAIIDAAVNSEASFCVLDAPIRATAAAFPRIPSRCNCADGEFCFDGSSSSGFLSG